MNEISINIVKPSSLIPVVSKPNFFVVLILVITLIGSSSSFNSRNMVPC